MHYRFWPDKARNPPCKLVLLPLPRYVIPKFIQASYCSCSHPSDAKWGSVCGRCQLTDIRRENPVVKFSALMFANCGWAACDGSFGWLVSGILDRVALVTCILELFCTAFDLRVSVICSVTLRLLLLCVGSRIFAVMLLLDRSHVFIILQVFILERRLKDSPWHGLWCVA